MDITIEGGKFDPNSSITITNTTNQDRIVEILLNLNYDIKNYISQKINFHNKEESTSTTITLSNCDIDLTSKNVIVYKLVGNRLETVDFTLNGKAISFDINNNDEIIIVERVSISNTSTVAIICIICVIVVLGLGIAVMFIVKKKMKKTKTNK
jgi:sigma54-dependent transcription regulator